MSLERENGSEVVVEGRDWRPIYLGVVLYTILLVFLLSLVGQGG